MNAFEVVAHISRRKLIEHLAARFIYDNFEPRPVQREASDFARYIIGRLKAGIKPERIPELWCFECWSANTECVCLELAKATPAEQALFDPEQGKKNLATVKAFGTLHPTEEQVRRKEWQKHAEFIREHGYSAWLRLIEGRMKVN